MDRLFGPALEARPPPAPSPACESDCACDKALATRDALVLSHLELLPAVAAKVKRKLPPSFDVEDLISHGIIALFDAASKFKPGGSPFWSYAYPRVRGAMVDSSRRANWRANTMGPIEENLPAENQNSDKSNIYFQGVEKTLLLDRLRAAVAGLPMGQREAIQSMYRDNSRQRRRSRDRVRRTLREHGAAIEELRRLLGATP